MNLSKLLSSAAAVAVVSTSTLARADVLWRGDFETGDLSQFQKQQKVAEDRLRVVEAPSREGLRALRVEVQKGDDPINASGNRNELLRMTNEREGDDLYYGWSTLFPSDYPLTPTWQVFMQWHHSGLNGAPPVRLVLGCSAASCGADMPDTMFLIVSGKNVWTRKLTLGSWHDFVLHVKWSADNAVGFVEMWYDGELVVPKTYRATLFPGESNYLKMGLYREESTGPKQVIYHDGFTIATALDDLAQFLQRPNPFPTQLIATDAPVPASALAGYGAPAPTAEAPTPTPAPEAAAPTPAPAPAPAPIDPAAAWWLQLFGASGN